MTALEIAIALAAVAAGASGLLPATLRRRSCLSATGCAVVGAGVVALVDRLRFPLAGVAVGSIVAALAVFSFHHRTARVLAAIGSVCATVVGGLVLSALPRITFPEPTGPSPVGTTRFEWSDVTRAEPATSSPHDARTVVVQVWYPAAPRPDDRRALYLGRTTREARRTADGIAATYGVPSLLLRETVHASTWAHLDAPSGQPGQPGQRWPVVLFSPGLAGHRAQNTSWAVELASHGYFVVGVDHPYDSAAVVLGDGSVIASTVRSTGDRNADDRATDRLTDVRADDLSFVLTQLEAMDRGEVRSPFTGRVDTRSIAATGHSAGGAAAIQAAQQDDRIDAVIDLDGFPRNVVSTHFRQPVLALVAGRGTGDEQSDATYRRALSAVLRSSDGGGLCLTIDGASHLTFTDAPLILPPLPSLIGSGGRRHGYEVVSSASLVFLDAVLRQRSNATWRRDVTGTLSELGALGLVCDG